MTPSHADIAIVGAGAAGLMAAIHAGRGLKGQARGGRKPRVLLLDGANTIGVKILVAGGGRCNVTHHVVDEKQYAGGSRNTIKKVLNRFDVPTTVAFFRELGVELKREDTGKLFPVTDRARTVLSALTDEIERLGVELRHPWRVGGIERTGDAGFTLTRADGRDAIAAERVVLATGGMALPKSGSDGGGYALATALGHTLTERSFPALVPVIVGSGSKWLTKLSGVAARVAVEVRASTGKRLVRFENDMLCTHFGLSGPAVMDASRWLTDARAADPGATLCIAWLMDESFDAVDAQLRDLGGQTITSWLRGRLSERLARAICERHGIDPSLPGAQLTKDARRALARALTEMQVEVTGDRGFTHAEATAGGVLLSEIDPRTMQSRVCPGLWLIGEVLDVDGRIGGFNFQWAWASGAVAGESVAADAMGGTG